MDWQTLFLKVEGRMGRKDYWIGVAILFVAGLILGNVPLIKMIWPFASIYFSVCVYGKRLHDIGQSAWMVLLPYGIIFGGVVLAAIVGGSAFLAAASTGSDTASAVGGMAGLGIAGLILVAAALASLGWVIWLGTRESEAGENQFGPPREVPLVTAF
jgi:uncharacterized membrane protein YhaH (DUF805 family)